MGKYWIFDFDGTLVDSEKIIKKCYEKITGTLAPSRLKIAEEILIGPTLQETKRIIRVSNISFKTVITTLKKWHNDGNLLLDYAQTDIQIQWLVPREDQYTLAPQKARGNT